MKRLHRSSVGRPAAISLLVLITLTTSAMGQLPSTSPNGNNMMLGSNLVLDSMSDPFVQNASHRTAAAVVLGVIRFPCRQHSPSDIVQVADMITAQGMEPLIILSAATDVPRNLPNVQALVGHATYFEFGNENNYAQGWTGAEYATSWRNNTPELRAAYPGIKLGGPTVSHFQASGSTYIRDFLNAIKNDPPNTWPDFISAHVYAEHGEDISDQAIIDLVHSDWGPGIDQIKADVQSILGISLPIAISEWNWDAVPEQTGDSRQNNSTFQHNFNFAVLDEFKARGVWMSNQYDYDGGAGGGKLDMYNKPQYTAFIDWNNANPPGPSNQPPAVSITSPSNGATFSSGSNVTINATASDADGSVTKVEFFQGGTKLGEDATSPYSYTWNTPANGSYTLTAKATDDDGAVTTSSGVNITVGNPPINVEAESMTLTNYVSNTNSAASGGSLIKLSASGVTGSATYSFTGATGTYDIQVWYFDENDGACTFRIYVAGTQVDSWTANQNLGSADPVAATRTSRIKTGVSIANGAQIKLEAVQNSQEWGRWDNVQFTLVGGAVNQPPTVSITSPANGATFTAPANITINATASDADGSVTKVDFYQGSTLLGTDNTSPYSFTWSSVAAGSYTLTAEATDDSGAVTTSSPVNITVNPPANQPPTVSITSPANGATFTAPANITINANASDSDGSVTLVEFFQGSTKLGEDSSSPYSYTWSNVAAGSYSLTAKATDNAGASTTSAAVNITVSSGGGGSYEAESGTLTGGATVTSSSAASGGAYVGNLHNVNASVTVSGVDGGSGGSFPLTIRYATNDANPSLDLYVNNSMINTITFASTGGWETFNTTSTNVTLNAGTGNSIKLQHNSGNIGGTNIDVLTIGTPPTTISKEAESMTLTNYVVNTNSSASGGNLIKLSASGVTGNATFNFTGATGTYSIQVWYFDENDGACTLRIYVGGTVVDEWTANQNLGSADPVAATRTSRTKTAVSIANGAQIKLEAVQNSQEWGRFDNVEIVQSLGKKSIQVQEMTDAKPASFALHQNYPNPFNPGTEINFELPDVGSRLIVTLKVYDMLGREVKTLADGLKQAGSYTVTFDGSQLATGIYLVRLTAIPQDGNTNGAKKPFMQTMKMLMTK